MEYFKETYAEFSPVKPEMAKAMLDAYVPLRRKRKDNETFTIGSKVFKVDYASEKKNARYQSRSKSYYFLQGGYVYRISDHWSISKHERSKKLNCGNIASCFWTNRKAEKFEYRLPGETYTSVMLAGKCKMSEFRNIYEAYRN